METGSYLTIPLKPGGRDRFGVDCWGLVLLIYADKLGIELPRHDEVNWVDNKPEEVVATVASDSQAYWDEVDKVDRRENDVVILRYSGVPWHVGVLVDSDRFIHADPLRGIIIERLESLHWKSRVIGYRRLKNV